MRVRYTIPVVHRGDASAGIKFELGGRLYTFLVEDRRLTALTVEVPNYPVSALPTFSASSSGPAKFSLKIQPDPFWPDVERTLMIVEGVMSIYGLERFVLEDVRSEWLPDSEDESRAILVHSFKRNVTKSSEATPVLYDMFLRSLLIAPLVSNREVALNFMRRGRDDLFEMRYVDAVYDYYLALETSFAGGAFKKREVVSRMLANKELVESIASAVKHLSRDVEFVELISKHGGFNYLKAGVKEILEHLVEVRGLLHHHSSRGSRTWHPSRQSEFRQDAVFLAELCLDVFNSEVTASMYSGEVSAAFAQVEIRSLDGRPVTFKPLVV